MEDNTNSTNNNADVTMPGNVNGNNVGDQQVFHRRGKSGDVAGRFIQPGSTMSDAITSTYIVSENQLNNIIRLWHKAQKWGVVAAQNDLLIKVNGLRSQDGRSILAMLMSSAQILVPEWGAEVSKKSKKDLETIKKSRENRGNRDGDDHEPGE